MEKVKYISKNLAITFLILTISILMSFIISSVAMGIEYVHMIFFLSVLFVARFTNGYIYGLIASVAAMFAINYAFTYPYLAFNFTLSGYPIKFIMLLSVSIAVSTLTTQIKRHGKISTEIEKEKIRGNLLRSVSHDIRTPLTSIVGSANALLENFDKITNNTKISLIKDISDEAEWLIRIVENILSITRMSNAGATIKKTDEIVEEILSESVYKLKKQFPDTVIKTIVPEELLFVPMDAILIEQVIFNLIENAIIHGMAGEICLCAKKCKNNVLFTVSDNGNGIPKEKLPSLFDGMYVSDKDKGDMKRNMGIGLSVCKSIVLAHGGKMNAYNQAGGGAVFEFTLPINKEE